jgi:hypothetical protein
MRVIEKNMVTAVRSRTGWKRGNTEVRVNGSDPTGQPVSGVYLFGNLIAKITYQSQTSRVIKVEVTLAGWPTPTTRSRLNAIARAFQASWGFNQSRGETYFTDNTGHRIVGANEWMEVAV